MAVKHQTIAITGAGSGFGRAIAEHYAAKGWRVAVTDNDETRAQETLAAIGGEEQGHFAVMLDVREDEHWARLKARVQQRWPGLGILVNNAGVAAGGSLEETPLKDWQWIIDIDLMGVVRGCHCLIPLFRGQGHGHIVNIASFAGLAGAPRISAYGCAKAGVVAVSEMTRAELADAGVGVSVVCPAFVKTNLMESFRSPINHHKAMVEKWMSRSGVSAVDVANAVSDAVDKQRFLVLTHGETRWMWRLKRWFPELYFRVLMRSTRAKR